LTALLLLAPLAAVAELAVHDSVRDTWAVRDTHHLRAGEPVALVYVELGPDGCRAPVAEIEAGGRRRRCAPLAAPAALRWYEVVAQARDYANLRDCAPGACLAPIVYDYRELVALRGQARIAPAALAARLTPGTHRLWAATAPPPGALATVAPPPALALVVRRDESYTGYLTELLGVPFVLWPQRLADGSHQTDARLGADCVALAVYGRRRLGHALPYVAPPALHRYAAPIPPRPDGMRPVAEGDVLHFGFQTAVLYEDRAPRGVLNDDDRVIHTYHTRAEIAPFGALPYRGMAFEVLRWRERYG
jgi:hypothetical protein